MPEQTSVRGQLNSRQCVQESILRIELLTFFQANLYTIDTVAGLARRLHRAADQVEMAVSALAKIGILEEEGVEPHLVYRLRHGELIGSFFEDGGVNQRR